MKKVKCIYCKERPAAWRYQEVEGEPEICDACHREVHNPLSWARVGEKSTKKVVGSTHDGER